MKGSPDFGDSLKVSAIWSGGSPIAGPRGCAVSAKERADLQLQPQLKRQEEGTAHRAEREGRGLQDLQLRLRGRALRRDADRRAPQVRLR
jgi:hypothetical protein